jgi:hypothetical protein
MSTARPFAYNTGSNINGTEQVGDLAVGLPSGGFPESPNFWNGPDEDLGYVIAYSQPDGLHPTPISGVTASLGFWRSKFVTDESFLELVLNKTGQTFATGDQAKTWLNDNGYWTSYLPFPSSVLSLDAADYTSGAWIDSVGGKSFTLYNSPTWSSSNGGYFSFNAASAQHAICSSSLPNLNTWSVAVWHYYTGINTGAAPCIVTETFPGNTSNINYSLGNNNTPLSSGFFDGDWRTTSLAGELQQNNWYYIVGTYDGATLKAYVNDSLISSVSYTGTPISSQGGIRLMRRWDLADYWGGRLAKVDIYDEAIGSSQISSIFNTTKSRFGL